MEAPARSVGDRTSLADSLDLHGRVALVTGGGRGIGRAIALGFAELGAGVAVLARSKAEIEAVAGEITERGGTALAIPTDMRDATAVQAAYSQACESLGFADIVVNNAGNLLYKPFVPLPGVPTDSYPGFEDATTDEEWESVLDTHLGGSFYLLREAVPAMLERRYGRVVNIVSNSIVRHVPFVSAYDTAKSAVAGLTRSLAYELARYGITVNAIASGHFYTALSAPMHDNPDSMRRLLSRVPMRRVGDLREIAALAAYLSSDVGGFLTGQVIALDGGESL